MPDDFSQLSGKEVELQLAQQISNKNQMMSMQFVGAAAAVSAILSKEIQKKCWRMWITLWLVNQLHTIFTGRYS